MDELKRLFAGPAVWRTSPGQLGTGAQSGTAAAQTPVNTGAAAGSAAPARAEASLLEQQVRWLLPRRGSVSEALAVLLDPARRVNILSLLGLPESDLARFESRLQTLESLAVGAQLKAAMALSGLFAEADLKRLLGAPGSDPDRDMRSLLQLLLERVEQRAAGSANGSGQAVLGSLRSQLQGALATLALNQLSAANTPLGRADPGGATASWLMSLPLRVGESLCDLDLAVEWHEESRASYEVRAAVDKWLVHIRVSLPGLGPLEAQLSIQGKAIAVVLYAQLDDSVRLLRSRAPLLQWALERCGLQVTALGCRSGTPRQAAPSLQPGLDCSA